MTRIPPAETISALDPGFRYLRSLVKRYGRGATIGTVIRGENSRQSEVAPLLVIEGGKPPKED